MQRCLECQNLLLDHLYELLDDVEHQFVITHLKECEACQAALVEAQRQQRLLAQAARLAVPEMDFQHLATDQRPADTTTPLQDTSAPTPVVFQVPERRRSLIHTLMMAASLLLTLGISGWFTWDYLHAKHQVESHDSLVAQLNHDLQDTRQQLVTLPEKAETERKAIVQEMRDRLFKVEVSGPKTYQPGVANEFNLRTLNAKGDPVAAKLLTARVVDEEQRVVYEESDLNIHGNKQLQLPADLPLTPGKKLSLEVVTSREGVQNIFREKLPLANPVYVTHLTTDKPLYQPGELIRFRSLTLERFSLKPAKDSLQLIYTLQPPGNAQPIVIGQGDNGVMTETKSKAVIQATGPDGKQLRGIGGGEHWLPADALDGKWVLTVHEANDQFPPQQRPFRVQNLQSMKYAAFIQLDRANYKPKDQIKVTANAIELATRKPLAKTAVEASLQFGRDAKYTQKLLTDEQGRVSSTFELPQQVEGKPKLSFTFRSPEGILKKVEQAVPLANSNLHIRFYPEGGELIAGIPNRVYFAVTHPYHGRDFKGQLKDGERVVAELQSLQGDEAGLNRGVGSFTFTPQLHREYRVELETPASQTVEASFPEVKASGVALHVPNPVTNAYQEIEAVISNMGEARSLLVGVYSRGRLLTHQQISAEKDQSLRVKLQPTTKSGGVTRITVFAVQPDNQLFPLAERLIYRQPKDRLWIHVDQSRPSMGEVSLHLTANDENQQPTSALLMMRVLDQRIAMLGKSPTSQSPEAFYSLSSELQQPNALEYADFLLSSHPKASIALDMVLATQGWRRFHKVTNEEFTAERFLANARPVEQTLQVSAAVNQQEVQSWGNLRQEQLREEIDRTQRALTQKAHSLQTKLKTLSPSPVVQNAKGKLLAYHHSFERLLIVWVIGGIFLLLLVLALLIRQVRDHSFVINLLGSITAGLALILTVSVLWQSTSVEVDNGLPERSSTPLALNKSENKEGNIRAEEDLDSKLDEHISENLKDNDAAMAAKPQPTVTQPRAKLPSMPMPQGPNDLSTSPSGDPKRASTAEEGGVSLSEQRIQQKIRKNGQMLNELLRQFNDKSRTRARDAEKLDLQMQLMRADSLKKALEKRRRTFNAQSWDGDKKKVPHKESRPNVVVPGMKGGFPGFGGKQALGGGGSAGGAPLTGSSTAFRSSQLTTFLREYTWNRNEVNKRPDFTGTVYWHPIMVLPNGKGTVNLTLPSPTASYEVSVFGHTGKGQLGGVKTTIRSVPSVK